MVGSGRGGVGASGAVQGPAVLGSSSSTSSGHPMVGGWLPQAAVVAGGCVLVVLAGALSTATHWCCHARRRGARSELGVKVMAVSVGFN